MVNYNVFEQLHVVSVVFWSPNPYFNFSDSDTIPASHPEISYTSFALTGNDQSDRNTINAAQLEIKKITTSKDTMNGVHFHFEDQAKFWTFIKVIDACKIEKANIFMPHQNDFWVFNPRPRPLNTSELSSCGGLFCEVIPDKSAMEAERIRRERAEKVAYVSGIMKTHAVSIFLFLLLVILTIVKIKRMSQKCFSS